MTDRGHAALRQTEDSFTVGPSHLSWEGDRLVIEVNEISNPVISRVKGRIVLHPTGLTGVELPLTPDGAHVWRPFAPSAEIEVDLGQDGWKWRGHGYFDANFGTRALEADFSHWCWGRFPLPDGAACFYDAQFRDGSALDFAVKFGHDGSVQQMDPPPVTRFARSIWGVRRETRCDPGETPKQVQFMLEAPFYSRAGVETTINGYRSRGVHEALDLDRFRGPWLMPMLAVRVPRRPGWRF